MIHPAFIGCLLGVRGDGDALWVHGDGDAAPGKTGGAGGGSEYADGGRDGSEVAAKGDVEVKTTTPDAALDKEEESPFGKSVEKKPLVWDETVTGKKSEEDASFAAKWSPIFLTSPFRPPSDSPGNTNTGKKNE